MQKALDQINIRLDAVLSNITGKSGMAIIGSILDGERDGMVLAKLCDARVKASAHGLARIIYTMVTYGVEFVEKGKPEFDREHKNRRVRNLKRNAEKLGFAVMPLEKAA